MIELCAIASGSNGNCYYIGNQHDAVLIDAGISARRIIGRMHERNLDPARIRAIFISHEHSDHSSGARVLGKRLSIPVFTTSRTFVALYSNHKPFSPRFFEPGTELTLGSLVVHPFLKNHDAAEPCSFRISTNGLHTGVFTDIGKPCSNVMHHVSLCHAIFLETNYDENMLWEGHYPWPLKTRIASDHGHLSNAQAVDLLKNYSGSDLKLVFLSHLSKENNTPEIAMSCFSELKDRYTIYMTSRYGAGEVVRLGEEE